ncbi:hypothetical protein [Paenibacillus sp. FSL H8-0259]|uniref:hypothetical protein n=1 Tax=Paenibacillus sp. FSL H8-0259 TaxID=1920423 RepID=UPI00273D4091|nr:hypothetical protein [Paenibacillus sp. FSL H8-0259]
MTTEELRLQWLGPNHSYPVLEPRPTLPHQKQLYVHTKGWDAPYSAAQTADEFDAACFNRPNDHMMFPSCLVRIDFPVKLLVNVLRNY